MLNECEEFEHQVETELSLFVKDFAAALMTVDNTRA
jgi:hypothetical protein